MRPAHLYWICLVLPALFPAAPAAQPVISVPAKQCVWHDGDNLRWTASALDDTGWRPYADWKPQPGESHLWVRCRADLSPLTSLAHPALQVTLYAAYQLYLNGQFLGGAGDLRRGDFSLHVTRSYVISASLPASGPSTIALRITSRTLRANSNPIILSLSPKAELRAGDASLLDALRAQAVLQRSSQYVKAALSFGIVGVVAFMLLALYFYDRSRQELLLLSIICLSLTALRLNEFCIASQLDYSFTWSLWVVVVPNVAAVIAMVNIFFALARRRVPLFFQIVIVVNVACFVPSLLDALLDARQPAWLEPLGFRLLTPVGVFGHMVMSLASFVAFWPWARIARSIRPLAALCFVWQGVDFVWYMAVASNLALGVVPNFFARWGLPILQVRSFATVGVLVALLALLFREQRQVTQDRALLAGEMRAASEIQRMLAPARIDSFPGFRIEAAFRPVREVGGDFYQVLRRGDSMLLVIGDVSGKGLKAAMTGTLAVGVLRTLASENLCPGPLLEGLNRRVAELGQEGFITCLCVQVSSRGEAVAANAGHLPPYRNGEEVALGPELPVGILPDTRYVEHTFSLAPGEALTMLSDGVVEAQTESGQLFGFERTRALTRQPADAIAQAAQDFGQEDDITVLTLTRLAAEASIQ